MKLERAAIDAISIGARPLLAVEELTVGYPVDGGGMIRPVDGLSLAVRRGEIVGLVGDAGSGKSTAALAMLGLARRPGRILSGRVHFAGRDLLEMSADELRNIRGREIGIIVQNPRSALNPMLRIGRQIGLAYRAHNRATDEETRQRALEMLRMVGINDPERRVEACMFVNHGDQPRGRVTERLRLRNRFLIERQLRP